MTFRKHPKYVVFCAVFFAALGIFFYAPPSAQAVEYGINLIPNPSLEIITASRTLPVDWFFNKWGSMSATSTYPVAGYDGQYAVRVDVSQYASGDAKWYFNPVAIEAGDYEFSDFYKSSAETYIEAQLISSTGTISYKMLSTLNASPDWKNATVRFTVPSNIASLTIFHHIDSQGWLATDTFSLRKVTIALPPPPTPDNLITNPSFEYSDSSGLPASWFKGNWGSNRASFIYPAAGQDGLGARIDMSNYSGGDAKWYFAPVPVTPNWSYAFFESYLANLPTVIEARFTLSDGTYQYQVLDRPEAKTAWTKFSADIVAPANATAVTVFHLIEGNGTLNIDNYSLRAIGSTVLSEGMVSLNFDDGWLSTYKNAYPILQMAKLKSTQYVFTNAFGQPRTYMSVAQLKIMQAAGHEIGSHGKAHIYLTGLDQTALYNEVAGSKQLLTANGIASSTFAYPFGAYNDTTLQTVIDAGYSGGRATNTGYNRKADYPYALRDQSVLNTTTITEIKSWIASAKTNKTWLILLFHEVIPNTSGRLYSTTPQDLQNTVNYLNSQKIKVVTTSEGLGIISQ